MKLRALLLIATILVSLALILIPAFLIQPFAAQTPAYLDVAYRLRAISPLATIFLGVVGLFIVAKVWRGSRFLAKPPLMLAVVLLVGAAVLSRQNHFEWMFRPLAHPEFVEVPDARHVEDADMVMAVQTGGETKAYPVRLMAYHHVLNDVVGGDPVVVTY
jgi:uncharacterized protein DUF3179